MNAGTRRLVPERAGERSEYCRINTLLPGNTAAQMMSITLNEHAIAVTSAKAVS
jgi:hypothetical protein